ncbi:MAG: desulfoferrodoxin family protein [Thermodesulfobacteriota bacterium]
MARLLLDINAGDSLSYFLELCSDYCYIYSDSLTGRTSLSADSKSGADVDSPGSMSLITSPQVINADSRMTSARSEMQRHTCHDKLQQSNKEGKMKNMRVMMFCLCAVLLPGLIFTPAAAANESAIEIEAPAKAAVGEEIVIVLNVSHDGNNFIHHTEWVELRINGETAERWEYSMFSKPPDENFSVSFSHTVENQLEIEAEASCSLHGSRNVDEKTVSVEASGE